MRRRRIAGLIAGLAIATSACSLFTSLDGLSGGSAAVPFDGAGADVAVAADVLTDSDVGSTLDVRDADAGDDAGPNLHPQGTFETGSCDPWVSYQGSLDFASPGHTGSGACRACAAPGATSIFSGDDNGASGDAVLGATYHAEGWVRSAPNAPAPPNVALFLRSDTLQNGNFVQLELNESPEAPIDATWQRFETSLDITMPGGTINVFIAGPAAAGACFLFDDVVLRRVN